MTAVCTVAEMRTAEGSALATGTTATALMERAGAAIFGAIMRNRPDLPGRRVLCLIGPGSNGGDGLIVARRLAARGCRVDLLCSRPNPQAIRLAGEIPGATYAEDAARAGDLAVGCDFILDGLLGIGSAPPLRGPVQKILAAVAGSTAYRIAIDQPSGVCAQTGESDPEAFTADLTIAAGPCKLGVLQFPARPNAGRIVDTDIGLGSVGEGMALTDADALALLPARPPDGHKGTFGRVVAISGSRQYRGAAGLVCAGAQRAGAGYVELAAIEPVVAATAARMAGPTYTLLPGSDGSISEQAVIEIGGLLARASALAVGPGLSLGSGPRRFLTGLLGNRVRRQPLVLDADGLTLVAPLTGAAPIASPDCPMVLTPHPGEMARLLAIAVDRVNADRLGSARTAAARSGAVVVLKGAGTIIARPDGHYCIIPLICPALATAGSGDVLTGIIAGLLAQGRSTWDAARLGSYLHARSGQLALARIGPLGVIAADLPDLVPHAAASLRAGDGALGQLEYCCAGP